MRAQVPFLARADLLREIGVFVTKNLSKISDLSLLQVKIGDNTQAPILNEVPNATILSVPRTSPTSWKAMLEAAEPFTVVLTETYDSSWVASANGERISSIPVHGSLTGFSIDKTGSLQITIEYEPQRWFFYGSIISVSTFLARFVCITSDYSRSKDLVKQVKHRFTRNKQQQEMMETTQGNKS